MLLRTDLAVEIFSDDAVSESIHISERGRNFRITEIKIDDDSHIDILGKGKGTYITLESKNLSEISENYETIAEELSEELKKIIPEGEILVAGIGNSDITPDAIGPLTAKKILATRHLQKELYESDNFLCSLRKVSCIAGGVLGQTGIETAEIINAVCKQIHPSAIIAVDALACSDISRLGTTIQITDTGISPGSGVANSRCEISEKVLGIPVIAIGVPSVVDMYTIIRNFTDTEPNGQIPNMLVTPRDVDRLVERVSQLIALGINLALQPALDFHDVQGLF